MTKSELSERTARQINKSNQITALLKASLNSMDLTDSEKMQYADIYPTWQSKLDAKTNLVIGEIVSYGINADNETQLYAVIQTHTVQSNWTPDTAVSLFNAIGFTDTGTPIWTQPLGTSDAYMQGDIVSYNDTTYTSTMDNNVWKPTVYGWAIQE